MRSQEYVREKLFSKRDFPVTVIHWKGLHFDDLPLRRHNEMELQFIYQGAGQYFIGSRQYQFHKNSLLVIHGNEPHAFVKEGGLLTEKMCILFSPQLFSSRRPAAEAIAMLKETNHLVLPDKLLTRSRLISEQIMEELKSKESSWKDVVTDLLETLLIILGRCTVYANAAPVEDNPLINGVVDYLEQHFADNLSLIGVAEHFSMSPYRLSKVFKQKTGVGFKQYLIRCRISEAKRLLEQTDWTTSKIAYDAGFHELSTFNRAFRSVTGVRPSTYRKLCT